MELIIFIIFIGFVGLVFHYNKRIGDLEDRINRLEGNAPCSAGQPRPIPSPAATQQTPLYSPEAFPVSGTESSISTPTEPGWIERLVDWVKKDFMMKLGAFLLLLAFGWFVSYAIAEQWIGPAGQISLGLLAGLFFLGLGVWRIDSYRHQGAIFTVLGAAIIMFTLYAAHEIYDMFTPVSTLSVMFLSVVFVAFVSVRYKSEKLAYTSLFLGSAAPLFVGVESLEVVPHFTYLLVITLGTLWVVWLTGWTRLILVSLVITYLYSITFIINGFAPDRDVVLMFSFIFVGLYFAANMVSLVRRHGEEVKHLRNHTLVALGTAVFLFTWIEAAVEPEWKSLLYVAWALIFALGTYVVYTFTANYPAFYLYGATAVALIGMATAAEFAGPVLTLAYLFEISVLLLVSRRLGLGARTSSWTSLLLVIPVLLSLKSFTSLAWHYGVFHEDFVVLGLTAAVLGVVGLLLRERSLQEKDGFATIIAYGHLTVSALYAGSLVWLILHALFAADLATMLALIVYTMAGIGFFVSDGLRHASWKRVAGSLLIGFVVLRLLFIDIWDMSLGGRVVTFLIIGALLISTAFLNKTRRQSGDSVSQK